MNPVRLLRAQILTGKGGRGGADGIKGTGAEQLHLAARRHRRHGVGAQSVHRGLKQNAADGGDGILQTHGKAHVEKVPGINAPQPQILPAQVEHRKAPHHIPKAQHAGNQLAEQSGPAGARHAHPEGDDEHDVQHHIQKARQNQKHQRRPGIAQGADDAGKQIVEHGSRNAQEDHPDIIVGIVKGLRRGIHPGQNLTAQDGGGQGHNQGDDGAQPDHVAHEFAQAVKILLSELLRHRDGKSGAHAVAQTQHQKVYGAGGANACQSLHAQEFAHHNGVHHAVELLEEQTEEQGQHKRKNQPHRGADG